MSMSLTEWAKRQPPNRGGAKCWMCSIPHRKEADDVRRAGTSVKDIWRGLIEVYGYDPAEATLGRVRGHYEQGRHHEVFPKKAKGKRK